MIEQIEPRILYSADLNPAIASVPAAMPQAELRVVDASGEFTNFSDTSVEVSRQEVVFVDTATPDYQQLVDGIGNNDDSDTSFDVVLLDGDADGITQISDYLAGRQDVSAIHIVSHGSDAAFQLGQNVLDSESVKQNADQISLWGNALTSDADLMIYGCDVAQSDAGRSLIDSLARLTGADVAASTDLTGSALLGGDWDLEYLSGDVETAIAFGTDVQQDWIGVLPNADPVFGQLDATPTFTVGGAPVVLDADVVVADSELDALNGGAGNYDGASVTLMRSGGINSDDMFGFNAGNGITQSGSSLSNGSGVIATFDNSTPGQLIITFSDSAAIPTSADVDKVLQQITYANSSPTPPVSAQIDWTFADGAGGSDNGATVVSFLSPVAHWKFNEGSGQVATDSQGNNDGRLGNTAAAEGTDPVWTNDAQRGSVLTFDGSNDYVGDIGLGPAGSFSVAGWVKADSSGQTGDQAIYATANGTQIRLGVDGGDFGSRIYLHAGGTNDYVQTGAGTWTEDSWHHLAGTWDGGTARIYLNGVELATTTVGTPSDPTAETARIGKLPSGDFWQFPGAIDDLRVYDDAISAADVAVLATPDSTAPTLLARQTADLNGDGFIDAIHLIFSEAISDATVNAADWDVAGVTGEAFVWNTNGDTADDADREPWPIRREICWHPIARTPG